VCYLILPPTFLLASPFPLALFLLLSFAFASLTLLPRSLFLPTSPLLSFLGELASLLILPLSLRLPSLLLVESLLASALLLLLLSALGLAKSLLFISRCELNQQFEAVAFPSLAICFSGLIVLDIVASE
jgi:hypothetical protein